MDKLHELKDQLIDEIIEYADKGRKSKDDAMTLKALTGSVDHLCNIIDGMENEYSGTYDTGMSGSYNRSYNRGRGSYNRSYKRDSRGRYSSDGYSRDGGMVEELRELMQDAPDERTRTEFQRFITKIESM